MNIQDIKNQLQDALDSYSVIQISYQGENEYRTIHPYFYGTKGERVKLHAYQTGGPSASGVPIGWKNFVLSEIKEIRLTDKKFIPPDEGYNSDLEKYSKVEYEISFQETGDRKP